MGFGKIVIIAGVATWVAWGPVSDWLHEASPECKPRAEVCSPADLTKLPHEEQVPVHAPDRVTDTKVVSATAVTLQMETRQIGSTAAKIDQPNQLTVIGLIAGISLAAMIALGSKLTSRQTGRGALRQRIGETGHRPHSAA